MYIRCANVQWKCTKGVQMYNRSTVNTVDTAEICKVEWIFVDVHQNVQQMQMHNSNMQVYNRKNDVQCTTKVQ